MWQPIKNINHSLCCCCCCCCCMDRDSPPTQLLPPHEFVRWQRHKNDHLYKLGSSDDENNKKQRQQLEEAWIKAKEHIAGGSTAT